MQCPPQPGPGLKRWKPNGFVSAASSTCTQCTRVCVCDTHTNKSQNNNKNKTHLPYIDIHSWQINLELVHLTHSEKLKVPEHSICVSEYSICMSLSTLHMSLSTLMCLWVLCTSEHSIHVSEYSICLWVLHICLWVPYICLWVPHISEYSICQNILFQKKEKIWSLWVLV
jgi:hypothetical protein